MGVFGLRFSRSLAPSIVAFLLICGAVGCGTSSSTSVVSPSPSKCTTSVTNSPPELPAAGGGGTITVTAERECVWSARAEASWITLRGTSGQGTASVNYTVAANPAGTPRRGQVVVSEQTIDIMQAAAACRYTAAPSQMDLDAAGGEATVTLTAPGGCTWRTRTDVAWITRVAPGDGAGSTTVRLTVAPNTGALRRGTVTVGDATVHVRQAGPGGPPPAPAPAPVPTCTYDIKPTNYDAGRGPDDVRIQVTAPSGCAWTATSPVDWVTLSGNAGGSGDGTVRLLVEANNGPERKVELTIADDMFRLRQYGCTATIKPTWYDAGAGPDEIRIAVTADRDCAWTSISTVPWVTIAEGATGSGTGTVRLLVKANTGGERSVTLTIAGQSFKLRQLGSS
jgi:hypothetical protein